MNYTRLYIPNSIVFITVVTSKRREILIDNIELLKHSIANAHKFYEFSILAICVLKDHFHVLIKTKNIKDYSKIITLIKRTFSQNIDINIMNYQKVIFNEKNVIYSNDGFGSIQLLTNMIYSNT